MKTIAGIAMIAIVTTGAAAMIRQHPTAETKKAVAAALADPARADQAGDDARRKPAEVLAFAGIGPRDRVIDVLPGAGYWTRIFAGAVGPKGQVYALWPKSAAKYAEKSLPALLALKLPNVVAEVQATDDLTVPKPVDLVWTAQNYHDIANEGAGEAGLARFNGLVFAALKGGGTYIVIDHSAPAGTGLTDTQTLHRIDKDIVIKQVTAAGFKLVGEIPALANRADDRTLPVFDPAIRGKTDQFVLKFRKPG